MTTIEKLIESLQQCDPETLVNICLFDGDSIRLGDNVHADDNGDFVLISGKIFHQSEQSETDWQKIVDDLDEFPGEVSSDAMGTLQSLAGPGPDEIREAIQVLRNVRDRTEPFGLPPVLNAIIALSELETN